MPLIPRFARRAAAPALLIAGLLVTLSPDSCGQLAIQQAREARAGRAVPRDIHFLALEPYYAGNYRIAINGFQSAARSGIVSTEGRWIDSICYYSMRGECLYRMGNLQAALEQHELALRLALHHRRWANRMQWPPGIQAAQAVQIPWGPSTRQTVPGQFPDTVLSLQGTNTDQVVRQGGVLSPPELYPVRVIEILRCIAVSLRRRSEILGPLAQHERFTGELQQSLSNQRGNLPGWARPMFSVHTGLAQIASGDEQQGVRTLESALAIQGRIDHPLTAIALVEIGKHALANGKLDVAARSFFEASISAAQFAQPDVLEEALLLASKSHMLLKGQDLYPPLVIAATWSQANNFHRAQASILLAAAGSASQLNQSRPATALMSQANRATTRTDLMRSDFGPRWQFQSAAIAMRSGNISNGQKALVSAVKSTGMRSTRQFQIARTAALLKSKEFSPRVAGEMFAVLLREPTEPDWMLDPFQTIQYCMTPQNDALNVWLEVAMERNEPALVLHVGEMIRRQKFFAELPMGGRLLGLRWVLNGPSELRNKRVQAQRKALVEKYPDIATQLDTIKELQRTLRSLPPVIQNKDHRRQYEQTVKALQQASQSFDNRLIGISLNPDPAERMFPPLRTLDEIQTAIQPKQGLLVLTVGKRRTWAMLLTSGNKYKAWELRAPARTRKLMMELMRDIGNQDKDQILDAQRLTDEEWKQLAQEIFRPLAQALTPSVLASTDELVIVPDGFFWHLPFELLQVPGSAEPTALIEQTRIRYLPTASLAIPDPRPTATGGDTAIAVGRLFGRQSDAIIKAAGRELLTASPQGVALRRPLPAGSSLLATRWDQLIILDDVDDLGKGVFNWSPAQIDRGSDGSTVASWMKSPWGAPHQLILPGFHTACEDGLRGRIDGDEMLLTTCGLMASGVRTMLLSRWRTGGQMSMDLVREFVQETPRETASAAWQRSVLLARSSELDPNREPRLSGVDERQMPKAEQPFFWSGFLLIDTGSKPAAAPAP